MAKKKEIPWLEIRAKYLSGEDPKDIALKFSKYNLTPKKISDKAYREKWKKDKKKINEELSEKISENIINRELDRNAKFLEASDLALEAIIEYLMKKLYNKHVIKTKLFDVEVGKITEEITETKELDAPDTKAFANMIACLEKIQKGHRLAEGLDNPEDKNVNVSLDLKTLKELFENDNS